MIDLDNSSLTKAVRLASTLILTWKHIGDCLILQSSGGTHRITTMPQCEPNKIIHYNRDNFMLIFDNIISYNLVCKIIEILAGLEIVQPAYFEIRKFRGDVTMRVSSKSYSDRLIGPPGKVGYVWNPYVKKGDGKIRDFEDYLEKVQNLEADDVLRESYLYRFFTTLWRLCTFKP